MNRNQIILLIGGILLLCLCVTLVGGGATFVWWSGSATETIAAFEPSTTKAATPSATDTTAVDSAAFEPRSIYSGGRLEQLHAVFDNQGTLYVFVRKEVTEDGLIQSEELFHLNKTPDGAWSEAVRLPTEEPEAFDPELVDVIDNPVGQVCTVLGLPFDVHLRCLNGTEWPTVEAVQGLDEMAVAFSADGSMHYAGFSLGSSTVSVDGQAVPNGDTDELINETALLIDETGIYHLAWKEIGGTLRYVSSPDNGQTWSNVEILAEGETKVWAVLHLESDRQGGLHLAWTGNEGIFYRRWQAETGWAEAIKLGRGLVTADLAVDGAGLAHVAWGTDGQLHYAQQQPDGNWLETRVLTQAEVIDAPTLQRERLALAVDAQGQRHFVWVGADRGLYYGLLP